MTIAEWLAGHSGPYEVGLFTVKPGGNPAELTAGQVVMPADEALVRDGRVVFSLVRDGVTVGEMVLAEVAVGDGTVTPDGWAGDYANLTVPLEGFYKYVMLTVRCAEVVTTGSEGREPEGVDELCVS